MTLRLARAVPPSASDTRKRIRMGSRRHRPNGRVALALVLAVLAALCLLSTAAQAAAPPQVGPVWSSEVTAASATLHGEIDTEGEATTYL